jgi:predicted metal-binding protein
MNEVSPRATNRVLGQESLRPLSCVERYRKDIKGAGGGEYFNTRQNLAVFRFRVISMVQRKNAPKKFDFLKKLALDKGAVEAKVISANQIVIEDRVVLKCRSGCPSYGKKLTCPPFVPTVSEFRKMLKNYTHALLIKFGVEAEADDEVSRNYLRFQYDPNASKDQKEKVTKFLSDHAKDRSRMHLAILELEKAAFTQGYAFAMGLFGPCYLCEECNVKNGVCIHPTMARFAEHAVGVNVKKTTEKAGIPIRFPFQKKPDRIALLLID